MHLAIQAASTKLTNIISRKVKMQAFNALKSCHLNQGPARVVFKEQSDTFIQQIQQPSSFTMRHLHSGSLINVAERPFRLQEDELGEAPVSVQPTDYLLSQVELDYSESINHMKSGERPSEIIDLDASSNLTDLVSNSKERVSSYHHPQEGNKSKTLCEQTLPRQTQPIQPDQMLTKASQGTQNLSSQIPQVQKMQNGSGDNSIPKDTQQSMEVQRLKLQNGLLIVGKRLAQAKLISKQVFFGRWRSKVQNQKQVLAKVFRIAQQFGKANDQLSLKKSLQEWKAQKDMHVQAKMDDEMSTVLQLQKAMLTSIQKSFIDRQNSRTIARFFKAYLELHRNKRQQSHGCTRLERVLRRLLYKRYKNSWKAMNLMPFVSDLIDEEVCRSSTLMSTGKFPANPSLVPLKPRHFSFKDLRGSVVSAHAGVNSRKTSIKVVAQDQQQPSPQSNPFSDRADILNMVVKNKAETPDFYHTVNIKAGVKLVTVTVRREVQQADKPSVRDLFAIWKIRTKFQQKGVPKAPLFIQLPHARKFPSQKEMIPKMSLIEELTKPPQEDSTQSQTPLQDQVQVTLTASQEHFQQRIDAEQQSATEKDEDIVALPPQPSASEISSVELNSEDYSNLLNEETPVEVIKIRPVRNPAMASKKHISELLAPSTQKTKPMVKSQSMTTKSQPKQSFYEQNKKTQQLGAAEHKNYCTTGNTFAEAALSPTVLQRFSITKMSSSSTVKRKVNQMAKTAAQKKRPLFNSSKVQPFHGNTGKNTSTLERKNVGSASLHTASSKQFNTAKAERRLKISSPFATATPKSPPFQGSFQQATKRSERSQNPQNQNSATSPQTSERVFQLTKVVEAEIAAKIAMQNLKNQQLHKDTSELKKSSSLLLRNPTTSQKTLHKKLNLQLDNLGASNFLSQQLSQQNLAIKARNSFPTRNHLMQAAKSPTPSCKTATNSQLARHSSLVKQSSAALNNLYYQTPFATQALSPKLNTLKRSTSSFKKPQKAKKKGVSSQAIQNIDAQACLVNPLKVKLRQSATVLLPVDLSSKMHQKLPLQQTGLKSVQNLQGSKKDVGKLTQKNASRKVKFQLSANKQQQSQPDLAAEGTAPYQGITDWSNLVTSAEKSLIAGEAASGLEQMISLGPQDFILSPESFAEQSPHEIEFSPQVEKDGPDDRPQAAYNAVKHRKSKRKEDAYHLTPSSARQEPPLNHFQQSLDFNRDQEQRDVPQQQNLFAVTVVDQQHTARPPIDRKSGDAAFAARFDSSSPYQFMQTRSYSSIRASLSPPTKAQQRESRLSQTDLLTQAELSMQPSSIEQAFQKLRRVVQPRIERYNIELFLKLCQLVDEEQDQEDESFYK